MNLNTVADTEQTQLVLVDNVGNKRKAFTGVSGVPCHTSKGGGGIIDH